MGAVTSPEIRSARRQASATIVGVGPTAPPVGNTALPATDRLGAPCTRQSASTTPVRGDSDMPCTVELAPEIPTAAFRLLTRELGR